MAYTLEGWSRGDTPATIHDMARPGAWERLLHYYANNVGEAALGRIFEIARGHGVTSVLVETRYIDADWRSQLARFYNGTFRRYPSVCHRLHFFTRPVPEDLADLTALQDAYRGYTVLRPLLIAPVGRTMIAPPDELLGAVRCEDTETVEVFGWRLSVTSMPFISQDTQFLRCAHASVWMVLRHAHLGMGLPRLLPHDIHDAAVGGVVVGRQLPSDGLSGFQLFAAMERLGLSPTRKELPPTKEDEERAGNLRLYAMVCRYLNSSLPPIVISNEHAWVIVAYKRAASSGNETIELWRHDDARGPYLNAT